ncbi:hypothetical protein AWP63_20445 [Escherichia coli]|nr:hypothetical protein AWP63_20445 [Escherichia coli]
MLSLQHQSHGLPPHGQMCRHRRLTSSRLPCSVPLRTRYAPPLPPSVQNGAVPLCNKGNITRSARLNYWG